MKTKKIIIFTMSAIQSQFEASRVEDEAKKLGVPIERVFYRDLQFRINDGQIQGSAHTRIYARGKEITGENTAGIWFRVAGTKSGKYVEARNLLIRSLQKEVFCDNAEGYLNWPRMGKISQHGVFVENDIPVVPTRIFYTKEQMLNPSPMLKSPPDPLFEKEGEANKKFFGWEFPIIAKHERGYQGRSVRKFENWAEVKKFVNKINEKNLGMFLWQKCLPTKWDIRVIVIDGKAIGAMKRSAKGKEFRSNFSLGGEVEKWEISKTDQILAEKVAKVCGLDYCGVDIMKDEEGRSYILEVNRQCQFKGFEESTKINVARKVVEMLIDKA